MSIGDLEAALRYYGGRFLGENIYFHILGGAATIRLMILKYKILICKKTIIAMMFNFLLAHYLECFNFQIITNFSETKEIHSVHKRSFPKYQTKKAQ